MAKKRRRTKIVRPEVVRQFAERLREVRRTAGLTQRQLADAAHLSEGYVARLEAGDTSPGLDLMSRLAAALSVPLADLLPATTPPPLDDMRQQAGSLIYPAFGNNLEPVTSASRPGLLVCGCVRPWQGVVWLVRETRTLQQD
jgi:transcriptional regulator with XRE-family HTH domain